MSIVYIEKLNSPQPRYVKSM